MVFHPNPVLKYSAIYMLYPPSGPSIPLPVPLQCIIPQYRRTTLDYFAIFFAFRTAYPAKLCLLFFTAYDDIYYIDLFSCLQQYEMVKYTHKLKVGISYVQYNSADIPTETPGDSKPSSLQCNPLKDKKTLRIL
jgi:hypothetical protein